jgi:hypothetical protein
MGCDNQCCFTLQPVEQSICEFVLGPDYVDEETTDNVSCYTGLNDTEDDAGQQQCFGCDLGCRSCVDRPDYMIDFWSIDEDGYGYLRPKPSASRNRNARNQLADFPTKRPEQPEQPERKPELFTRVVNLQRSRCKRNDEDLTCWGDEVGHPCQCFHEQDATDTDGDGIKGIECGPLGLLENAPVPGFMRDRFFYHYTGWPLRDFAGMTCSKWDHGTTQTGINPEYDIQINDDKRGQAQVIWGYTLIAGFDPICNIDVIAGCAARVPVASECADDEGDCGSGMRTSEGITQAYYPQTNERFKFEYMRFDEFAPTFRTNTPANEFKARVFAEIPNLQDENGTFDAVQHQVGPQGNPLLGFYERTWNRPIEEGHVVETVDAYTRWGHCPITAEIVITKVEFKSHVQVLRTKKEFTGGGSAIRNITPMAVVHIEVQLGVRAVLDGSCEIAGEEVVLTYPEGSRMPVASPAGNDIVYPFRIPAKIDWHGRLGFHSSPEAAVLDIENDPDTGSGGSPTCRDYRYSVGTVVVPGLPADIDSDDPNQHYTGQVAFHFGETV